MSELDAVAEIARLWDLLPSLVGTPWDDLEPDLTEALEDLAAAGTDQERARIAVAITRLCKPYPALRRALAPLLARDPTRSPEDTLPTWGQTSDHVIATLRRSAYPGGDRWFTAETPDEPSEQPWQVGVGHLVTIRIITGDVPPEEALTAKGVPDDAVSDPAEDDVALRVQLDGDADIETISAELTLPRAGSSPDQARFRVTPRPGTNRLTLVALVTRRSNDAFIQHLMLTVDVVDEAMRTDAGGDRWVRRRGIRLRAGGHRVEHAFAADGADATLVLDGRRLVLLPHGLSAEFPFTDEQLRDITEWPRATLREIAFGILDEDPARGGQNEDPASGRCREDPVHQVHVTIPQTEYEVSLAAMVRAGVRMHNSIFGSPRASSELRAIGAALASLDAANGPLRVEIWTPEPIVPWHLLAFPGPDGADLAAPSRIFGLRHRVSYVPSPRSTAPAANLRAGDGPLRVVLALNRDLDEWRGTRRDLVDSQYTAWRLRENAAAGALTVAVPADDDVLDVLLRGLPPAELVYFFCHAGQDQAPGRLGPLTATLGLSGRLRIRLEDLIDRWPLDYRFEVAPLVMLNACATITPSHMVYAGFVPFLLGKGARGVIGTEGEVPAVFAAAWAKAFFGRVLDGIPLADAAFEVTREFVDRDRNLLGLIYALHCDGRSRVAPAVPGATRETVGAQA